MKKSDNLQEDGSPKNNRYQKERRDFPSPELKMKNERNIIKSSHYFL